MFLRAHFGGSQTLLADCLQLIESFLLVLKPPSLDLDVVLGFDDLGMARFGGSDTIHQGVFISLGPFDFDVDPLLGFR